MKGYDLATGMVARHVIYKGSDGREYVRRKGGTFVPKELFGDEHYNGEYLLYDPDVTRTALRLWPSPSGIMR